jgi:Protein of unknown function (DUF3833)
MQRRHLLLSTAALGLAGCASPGIELYRAERPEFDLRRYFDGRLRAHGLFMKRSGEVARRFVVEMNCSWSGPAGAEEGVLDERFTYSDGKTERRVWRLRHLGNGRYSGRADDVVGEAQGESAGNAFHWTYTLRLPVDDSVYEVQFDDWMYLIDERVMINKATMSKFGFRLGEVLISFEKLGAA